MNKYPKWWDTTITIFNKFEDPTTYVIRWYKTKVEGVFWKNAGDKVNINGTVLETNNIICRIRKDNRYLPKGEWINKPNDEMANFFTLGKEDIIVRGDIPDIIDEYTTGIHSNDLLNKYKKLGECLVIERVSDNTGEGRGQEHYYVKGV